MRVKISKIFRDSKHFLNQTAPGLPPHPLLPKSKRGVPLFFCRSFATAVATFVFHSSGDVRGPSPLSLGVFPRYRRFSVHRAYVLGLSCFHGVLVYRTPLLPHLRFQITPLCSLLPSLVLGLLVSSVCRFPPCQSAMPLHLRSHPVRFHVARIRWIWRFFLALLRRTVGISCKAAAAVALTIAAISF